MLLYATTIDASRPNGPGVNEREFTNALSRRFGDGIRFVLPAPAVAGVVDDLPGRILFRPFRSRFLYLLSQLVFLRTLLRAARELRPDLVVVRCGQLPLGLALFARLTDIPMSLKTQGDPTMKYLCDKPGLKGWVARRLRSVNMWAARILAKRAVSIDCCTPELIGRNLNSLPGIGPDKFLLVGNATNVERFTPRPGAECRAEFGMPANAQVIGYVGGAPSERGGRQIIHAVAELQGRYPQLMGVVVGGAGTELESLRAYAKERGVADRCVIPGQVPYDTVPRWINSFDVGVAMDLAVRGDYVGSSNQKIRQYLACGKPVIASGGVNEFLEANDLGGLVMEDDLPGFVRLVDAYLGRAADVRQDHALRARRYAEAHFSVVAALEMRMARWREVGIKLPA